MASGHALRVHQETGKPVCITDQKGKPRWSDLWEGLPWIARDLGLDAAAIANGIKCRPYIDYPFPRNGRYVFTGWRARDHVGRIALTDDERAFADEVAKRYPGFILIEPGIPPKSNQNKQWGLDNWQALAEELADTAPLIQLVAPGQAAPRLDGVHRLQSPTFRLGAAVLERAAISVLPEGGLHHAAAALDRPAIVLFGGCMDPGITGYPSHVNIVDSGDGSPCCRWAFLHAAEPLRGRCPHCVEAWKRIDPWMVAEQVRKAVANPSRPILWHG